MAFSFISRTVFVLGILFAGYAHAISKSVPVIGGQELLVYNKAGLARNSFAAKVSHQMSAFGSNRQVRMLGAHVGVVAFGSTINSVKNVNEADLLLACEKIRSAEVGCEINHLVKSFITSSDSLYSSLYGLSRISAPSAWDISTGSKAVKVAVVDTGVDFNHPDLAANISLNTAETPGNGIDDDGNGRIDDYYGYDFANFDSNPMDDNSHGTHVAGTIGAVGNNSTGVVGVNWSVGIIPVKVLSASGSGSTAGVIAGIDYAISRGAQVINLSLGGPGYSQSFYESIQRANNAGVLVVAAAGNESNDNDAAPSYPANFNLPNIISVAATNSSDTRAYFSNYGANSVHIAAPGVDIRSTLPGGLYGSYSGTSMACPHVAGAAALIKAANLDLSMLQVKDILLNNTDVISSLNGLVVTSGRLNVAKAARAALGISPPAPTPIPSPTPILEPTPQPQHPGDDGSDTYPDDGDDDVVDEPSVLNGIYPEVIVKGRKAIIKAVAYDQDYFELEDVFVSLSCGNKLVGSKYTNESGVATFSYKLKSSSIKCLFVALDIDGVTRKKKAFRIKLASVRRR